MNLKNYDAYVLSRKSEIVNPSKLRDSLPGESSPALPETPPSLAEKIFRIAVLLLALLCLAATTARACGPNFPNNLLMLGDQAVLLAPIAHFRLELVRLHLVTSHFSAISATNSYAEHSLEGETGDLAAALKKAKVAPEEAERICREHRIEREKIKTFQTENDAWAGSGEWVWDETGGHSGPPKKPAPGFPHIVMPAGLPGEFTDYLEGASGWHNPADVSNSLARVAWERLLARPAAERKYKSTWAAYMLGKTWEDEDAEKAAGYFKQVRELAKEGFADSIGLAAASLGWEARIYFHQQKYREAIELYLEQLATGDESAVMSLQWVASAALSDPEALPELAKNVKAQKVITAALISSSDLVWVNHAVETETKSEVSENWLNAVEAAGASDVDSAEKLALAAYQAGAFDVAQRWINRAKQSPVAQWLQAKLYLRAGKLQQGAALLAKVSAQWPVADAGNTNRTSDLADSLYASFDQYSSDETSVRHQVLGELGVLQLRRGEYLQALDALLHAGYWGDAAYVAERVLTTDELKRYVDSSWPPAMPAPKRASTNEIEEAEFHLPDNRENIRYLLARRLTRELRGNEARGYYPTNWLPQFDELVRTLTAGWDETAPPTTRAKALVSAAFIARTNGMELLGTELAPDYFIWGGAFTYGVEWEERATNSQESVVNVATTNEIRRASSHGTDPELRFHYRYQAATLAWEAAKLMPNNSDETAFVLCTAGSWLKDRDPDTADVFYKALVRRCRQTALGIEADRLHWFPLLDENGKFIPRDLDPITHVEFTLESEMPEPATIDHVEENPTTPPPSHRGLQYTVEPGDTLIAIVKALGQKGIVITVEDILTANPGLEPTKMATGRSIIIPMEPLLEPESTKQL